MQKNIKGVMAKVLALTLTVSVVGIQAPDADAAKKPKLSAKKVTIAQGSSKKVKIKNVKAKKIKKLTVSTNKKKIATVKKNGKTAFTIKGIKAGSAKVTAKIKIGKKTQKLSVKVTVTSKESVKPETSASAQPSAAASGTPDSSSAPASSTPSSSSNPDSSAAPDSSATPSAEATSTPEVGVTPAPNADVKRITGESNIKDPIITNVSIWGMKDNPYAEVGYDYTQYGPCSGILSKWFEVKDSFTAISNLFNPQTAQSVSSVKMMSAMSLLDAEATVEEDPVGTKASSVYATIQTGKLNYETKEEADVENHVVEFQCRTGESNVENQKIEVVADPAGGEGTALLVTGRASNWHGFQVDIADFVKDTTKDYRISLEIYQPDSTSSSKKFYIQTEYKDAEDGHLALTGLDEYPTLCMAAANANQWKDFSANYSSKNTEAAAKTLLCINWFENNTGDFYIRNVKVMEIESDKVADATEALAMDSLYTNTEKNYGFSFGAVTGTGSFSDENYNAILNKHFSSITIDNPLKMYSMLDQQATQANSVANGGDGMPVICKDGAGEEIVKWAYENGLGVRGHTIICDTAMASNCPYFFYEDYDTTKKLASREVVLARMESVITQCITYFEEKYPGTIYCWDLVNEAIEPSKGNYESGDKRRIQIKDNLFYDTIGSDYVEYAFLYGRKAVNALEEKYPDRNVNIKLFYNDYNCYQKTKRNAIVELIKSIQAFGQEQGMGNLIDGVGMQCYLGSTGKGADDLLAKAGTLLAPSTNKSDESIPNAIFMFNELGCKVHITELTVRNYKQDQNDSQAEFYSKFMQMIIDINNGTITKVLD